ncbi:hypothetical protein Btru_056595 [Bulinus truncatus]|nr:hypothetical protein Btru_056595 [Bulinus truncatus]
MTINQKVFVLKKKQFSRLPQVRNNVHGETLIYGSAIAVEPGVIPGRPKYCPYAYNNRSSSSTVTAFDIAVSYDYQTNTTEWYLGAKVKDRSNVSITADVIWTAK